MKRSVLESTAYLPYYFPLRMNSTFEKWGWIDGDELSLTQFSSEGASVAYPQHPLEVVQPDSLLNIVIIGIDSWNYRTMTPECTPNIYAFSQEAENYTQHISVQVLQQLYRDTRLSCCHARYHSRLHVRRKSGLFR